VDGAAPHLRLLDAGLFAIAACGAFFGAVAAGEREGAASSLAEAARELADPYETVDLGLVEHRVVRSSHRGPLSRLRAALAKGACYEVAVIVKRGAFVLLGCMFALACASSSKDDFEPNTQPDTEGGTPFSREAGPPDPTGAGEVFGHSQTTLYRVDTVTKAVLSVGDFNGCTYVQDIALDESSNIYGSTGAELVYIETNTAHCTRIAAGTFPNSLSFVPKGTVESDHEALVGFQCSDYVKIDPKTGMVTKIGAIGGNLESSGDIVSAKGGKTFVTVKGKDPSGVVCADCLIEIDPTTGKLVKSWGPIGRTDVFGLAFWAGDLYAFTAAGELLLVTLTSGKLEAMPIAFMNAPASFAGAGSTTSAPVGPVR
jgi:hypothetical protein